MPFEVTGLLAEAAGLFSEVEVVGFAKVTGFIKVAGSAIDAPLLLAEFPGSLTEVAGLMTGLAGLLFKVAGFLLNFTGLLAEAAGLLTEDAGFGTLADTAVLAGLVAVTIVTTVAGLAGDTGLAKDAELAWKNGDSRLIWGFLEASLARTASVTRTVSDARTMLVDRRA